MRTSLFFVAVSVSAAFLLSSCTTAPAGSKFATLKQSSYRATTTKGSGPKTVTVARKRKASPAQVQVAVVRVTNYLDSLSPEDMAIVTKQRYICVCTTQAPDSKGKVTCMAWDTKTRSFVGNDTFELVNPPPVPSTIQFESFTAIFVGVAQVGVGGQ